MEVSPGRVFSHYSLAQDWQIEAGFIQFVLSVVYLIQDVRKETPSYR